jgi:uncharacterized damage-inducible protein DinB
MTSLALVRTQFAFNQAMNDNLWNIITAHLTDAQFVQEDRYSRGAIRNQLIHMANAQRYWFGAMLGAAGADDLNPEDYPTRASARHICQQVDQESLDHVNRLTEAELEQTPEIWSQPIWVGLLQMTHHSTDHRSQILRALHDLGAPTFEQNFAVFMEDATPTTAQGLIEHISHARVKWDDTLRKVSADKLDQPVTGTQTVRDIICIQTWTERRLSGIIHNLTMVDPTFNSLPASEQANFLAENRALSPSALLDQHQSAHRDLLAAIHTLTDATLNSADIKGVPSDERFWKIIASLTWWNYPGLSAPLRDLLQRTT